MTNRNQLSHFRVKSQWRINLGLIILAVLISFWMGKSPLMSEEKPAIKSAATKVAIFAGGCFWCVESDFDKISGVLETISGYTGGHTKNPTYKEVSYKDTGHYEAVKIVYNPEKVSFKQLLHSYWRSVDPTDKGGQFCDRGDSYRTAIFVQGEKQKEMATASKQYEQTSGKLKGRIVTPILEAKTFYPAETYHQDYYKKNPLRYKYYRYGCGRDKRIKALWGDEAHEGMQATH